MEIYNLRLHLHLQYEDAHRNFLFNNSIHHRYRAVRVAEGKLISDHD